VSSGTDSAITQPDEPPEVRFPEEVALAAGLSPGDLSRVTSSAFFEFRSIPARP
jgi:hypothetical protein